VLNQIEGQYEQPLATAESLAYLINEIVFNAEPSPNFEAQLGHRERGVSGSDFKVPQPQ